MTGYIAVNETRFYNRRLAREWIQYHGSHPNRLDKSQSSIKAGNIAVNQPEKGYLIADN